MDWIGIDLHQKRSRYVIVDQEGKTVRRRTIPSTPQAFAQEFSSFKAQEVQAVVEATVNWC